MHDDHGCGCFLYLIGVIIAIVVSCVIAAAVINSDLPDWLKYLILR